MKRLKELEDENRRLKTMYGEESLKGEIARKAMAKKVVKPSRRKAMANQAYQQLDTIIKVVCWVFSIGESGYHYQAKLSSENDLIAD